MFLTTLLYIVSLTVRLAKLEIANPHQLTSPVFANDECLDGETVMIVVYSQFTSIVQFSVIVIQ